jgi:hypothetical protein
VIFRSRQSTARRLAWIAGCAVLSLTLVLQIFHHYRSDLATHPVLAGPVTRLYASLGVPIVPRWDVGAYDVRAMGASAPSGRAKLTVRASIKNSARQAQPLPLLRVTLEDRFGNRVATRDVAPEAYLPPARRSSGYLSAGQGIVAEVSFVDPGANTENFEIDACLPVPEGGTACASQFARQHQR